MKKKKKRTKQKRTSRSDPSSTGLHWHCLNGGGRSSHHCLHGTHASTTRFLPQNQFRSLLGILVVMWWSGSCCCYWWWWVIGVFDCGFGLRSNRGFGLRSGCVCVCGWRLCLWLGLGRVCVGGWDRAVVGGGFVFVISLSLSLM